MCIIRSMCEAVIYIYIKSPSWIFVYACRMKSGSSQFKYISKGTHSILSYASFVILNLDIRQFCVAHGELKVSNNI